MFSMKQKTFIPAKYQIARDIRNVYTDLNVYVMLIPMFIVLQRFVKLMLFLYLKFYFSPTPVKNILTVGNLEICSSSYVYLIGTGKYKESFITHQDICSR